MRLYLKNPIFEKKNTCVRIQKFSRFSHIKVSGRREMAVVLCIASENYYKILNKLNIKLTKLIQYRTHNIQVI